MLSGARALNHEAVPRRPETQAPALTSLAVPVRLSCDLSRKMSVADPSAGKTQTSVRHGASYAPFELHPSLICFGPVALMLNLTRNVGADAESSWRNNEEKDEGLMAR